MTGLLLLCLVITACGSSSPVGGLPANPNEARGAPTWAKSFGGPENDTADSAIPTADGGYFFVGTRDASGIDAHFGTLWAVKLSASGDVDWERAIGAPSVSGPNSSTPRVYSRVVGASDGGAWLIGTEGGRDIVIARLDAAGAVLWTRSYDAGGDFPSQYFYPDGETTEDVGAATETADGGLIVASTTTAYVLTARDETGVDCDPASGASGCVVETRNGVTRHTDLHAAALRQRRRAVDGGT